MTLSEDQLQKIHAACVKVLPDAKIFLAQLVQKDTTNPPGKNYPEIATIIKTKLEALTYNVKLIETTKHLPPGGHGRRVNVLGTLKTKSSNPQQIKASSGLTRTKLLHFNGHFDVVPIGDRSTWQHDPFGANIVGNVMYGRGTSDMKGGIAAQVYAIEALREAKLVLRGDIGQSCVVDEETTGNENAGAGYLVNQKHIHSENTDAVVITEPLNPDNVCIGHRGAIWGTITFKGRATQSAMPALGVNALVHAARFIVEAEKNIAPKLKKKTQQDVIPEEARSPSLTFTMLQAGENNNTVPDKATLKFDRRLVTGESLTEAREQIKSLLDRMKTEDKTFCPDYREYYSTDPVRIDPSCDLVTKWKYGVKTVFNRDAGIVCSPGTDDQRFFFRDGGIKQTIVYGPGNIEYVHNADECLNLDDLQKSIEVMAIGAATFLGVD